MIWWLACVNYLIIFVCLRVRPWFGICVCVCRWLGYVCVLCLCAYVDWLLYLCLSMMWWLGCCIGVRVKPWYVGLCLRFVCPWGVRVVCDLRVCPWLVMCPMFCVCVSMIFVCGVRPWMVHPMIRGVFCVCSLCAARRIRRSNVHRRLWHTYRGCLLYTSPSPRD